MRPSPCFWLSLLAMSLILPTSARAEDYVVGPNDDLFEVLANLEAGDTVTVQDGDYATPGFFEVDWQGSADAPIVVEAAEGARPHIRGVSDQNVINLSGTHFVFRGFELSGGSHGIRLADTSHAVIEDMLIHDIGDVGISCNRPGTVCDNLVIRRNEIHSTGANGTGEGLYLGCHEGDCSFDNSRVELNWIHDTGGEQGDGIEIKRNTSNNVVRDNVIFNTNYPAITMYGHDDPNAVPNLVERNFVNGTGDNGIQIVGQVVVRNNIVTGFAASGIHSKPSDGAQPHDLAIVHNTVYGEAGTCLRADGWTDQPNILVANNAFYCPGAVAIHVVDPNPEAVFASNAVLGNSNAPGDTERLGMDPVSDLGDPEQLEFYPPETSLLVDAGDPAFGSELDFNLVRRDAGAPDIGAYEWAGAENPGWRLEGGFKPGDSLDDQDPDAGVGADAGASQGDAGSGGGGPSFSADPAGSPRTNAPRDRGCCASIAAADQSALPLLVMLLLGVGFALRTRRRH